LKLGLARSDQLPLPDKAIDMPFTKSGQV